MSNDTTGNGKSDGKDSKDAAKLFHIPAADTKGHSVKKAFRISPQLEMQIEMLLASKKWGYRTEGELFRHALVRLLAELDKQQPDKNSLMPQIMGIIEVTRREEEQREFAEVIDRIVKEVNSLITSGNKYKAEELMRTIIEKTGEIPDEYWRKRYKEELERRLAHVKRGGVRATLKLVDLARAKEGAG